MYMYMCVKHDQPFESHCSCIKGFARAVEMIRSTRPLSVNDQDSNRYVHVD